MTNATDCPMDEVADVDDIVTHGEAIVNGVRLHYVTAGPTDGDLVVLLHGFPECWYSWRHQLPALAEAGYRVLAPDMRGYNRSEKPHGVSAYRIEELVGDVEELIGSASREAAHVVGHDWGGLVAWATAIEAPEVVQTLTILNAPHPIKYVRELSFEQLRRSWYVFYFQIPWLPERLFAARDFALLENLFETAPYTPGAFSEADVERYKTALARPGAVSSSISYYRAMARDAVAGRRGHGVGSSSLRRHFLANVPVVGDRLAGPVPTIEAPTLVVWGERDHALLPTQARGLERYVEDVRVRRVPAASHWIQVERPEIVIEELRAFLP